MTFAGGTVMYDALGRLLWHTGPSVFLYDGDDLAMEYSTYTSTVLRRYVHGAGADEPLVWYEGTGTATRRFLHADERGSIVAITASDGSLYKKNSYDEYGIPAAANEGRFQYTGQTWHSQLGLYNYKARFYSPTLGRFLQTDPIGYGDGMNMYAYTGGDTVNFRDPFGLQTEGLNEDERVPQQDMVVTATRAGRGGSSGGAAAVLGLLSRPSMGGTSVPEVEEPPIFVTGCNAGGGVSGNANLTARGGTAFQILPSCP